MSKAILVIDMPKSCKECKLSSMYGTICPIIGDTYTADGKSDDCPLEPLPSRVDNLDLEVWNSRNGSMLAPKGLFNEIYNDKEDDDEGEW